MNSFWTVVGFTVKNKIKTKAFIISTAVLALLISVGVNIPYIVSLFDKDSGEASSIGYIQTGGNDAGSATGDSLKVYFEGQEQSGIKLVPYASQGDASADERLLKKAIADNEIKGYLEFGDVNESGFPEMTYKSEKLMEFEMTGMLQGALQVIRQASVLQNAGLTDEQFALLNTPIKIQVVQISATEGASGVGDGKTVEQQGVNMGAVYFIIIFLFMAVMISGQMIASEVTAEKSSRVMEILITSVSPLKSMFGKIFGMFTIVMLQLAVYLLVILLNTRLPHNVDALSQLDINLSDIDPALLWYSLVYFLTGFFLFATLYAAVGSIVSRTEDLGQAIMPMTIISLAGFYVAIFSLNSPDSMLVKVTSFIPLFSPFVMVLRLGLTDPPMWEVLTSIGILLVSIYIAVFISAKIYRTGVLMYGKRPSWKEIRKAMKAYKI